MKITTKYLENLRIQAAFDDFKIIADQPIRYKGDGSAPGPFDYFLASSVMCAAYFVKVYCNARNIATDDIEITQDNIVDPENRYKQNFHLKIKFPPGISEKDKKGILASMERCSVKRVIQNEIDFIIEPVDEFEVSNSLSEFLNNSTETLIPGKDKSLEETLKDMFNIFTDIGIDLEIASWRNPIPHIWSVHIRDAKSPMCFTNGKGSTKEAALCSALGEYLERLATNYFYADYYLGDDLQDAPFIHYPNEKWFISHDGNWPKGLMDEYILNIYNQEGELKPYHLYDINSGNKSRGICALPFTRISDEKEVHIPVNLIGNLFVSNGMSAGNSKYEARVQALSEILERAVRTKIITEEISLPDIPEDILSKYPTIIKAMNIIKDKGYPLIVKDASLGGVFPVINITILNPQGGNVYASWGAHPNMFVAIERTLTELLQGRSFESLADLPKPSFSEEAYLEHNNLVEHFIDAAGVMPWKFFSSKSDFDFTSWNFKGSTEEEYSYLLNLFVELQKEIYIADFDDLGGYACRVLVPDFSEIYQKEDLIWDNNNQALDYRDSILKIHFQSKKQLLSILNFFEEKQLDDYMPISELIGVSFEETTPWGQLDVGSLKCFINLKLGYFEEAKFICDNIANFNDMIPERAKFFTLLGLCLEIHNNPELNIEDYENIYSKLYSKELLNTVQEHLKGNLFFWDLPETNGNFKNNDKHLALIESYKKIHKKRSRLVNGKL